jgi:hypothetical protein
MSKEMVVLFDIADESFHVFTRRDFDLLLAEWKSELEEEFDIDTEHMDIYELVEAYRGDETFIHTFEV